MVAVQILVAVVSCCWLSRTSLASYSKGCQSSGGVDASVLTTKQLTAIENQHSIPCEDNDSERHSFYDAITENIDDVQKFANTIPTFTTHYELCRSARSCPGSSTITWCIHLYHPTEKVEICLDKNGVINATDYTHLLLLECYYSVEETCPNSPQGCLKIKDPKYFLHESIMVCSVQSENCSAVSSTKLSVVVTGHEIKEPEVKIRNTTDLVLGQTNLFLCEVFFFENRVHLIYHGQWQINGTFIDKIHEAPFCSLSRDCNKDTQTNRNDRVRAYEVQLVIPGCPFNTYKFREWLWIDNATEADAQIDYLCYGKTVFYSPFPRPVIVTSNMRLNPVFPLLNVTILEVPVLENIVSADDQPYILTVVETETFQWAISVEAGQGDELLWLHNGEPIPSAANILQVPSCSDTEVDQLFVVHWPAEDLGGYKRGLHATLVACHLTLPMAYGLYQCHLNRSRGSTRELWSALLQTMPTNVTSEVNPGIHIGFYIGLAAGVLVVTVMFFLALFMCCMRHNYMAHQLSKLNSLIFSTADVLTDSDVKGITESKNSIKRGFSNSLRYNDPFEFPREKLLVSDVLLGEGTFGRVMQAKAQGIVQGAPNKNVVAIKMCRENAIHQEVSLWEELQLMKKLDPHKNIVNLLGCCSTPNGPLCLIIEYALHGSLKDFLHEWLRKRSHASSSTGPDKMPTSACPGVCEKTPLSQHNSVFSPPSEVGQSDSTCSVSTEGMCPRKKNSTSTPLTKDSGCSGEVSARSASTSSYVYSGGFLHIEDPQNFAIQIAQGLQHLENMNVVHCDLAARNILIAEGFVLKIADFGMARDVSGKECYIKHKEGKIPVKWTPPEALQDHTFSYKSDMWSYGVTLWEIFSYGAKPYPDQKIQLSFESFIRYLKDGNRLPQPIGCPTYFYHLMQCCWKLAPEQRPSSSDMLSLLLMDTSHVDIENAAYTPVSFTRSSSIFPESQI